MFRFSRVSLLVYVGCLLFKGYRHHRGQRRYLSSHVNCFILGVLLSERDLSCIKKRQCNSSSFSWDVS